MSVKAPPVKMEAPVQTMLTRTHALAHLALLASTVKPTSLTALIALASMEGHAQTK